MVIGRAEANPPLSVEFAEFFLYLFIYRFNIHFRPYVLHVPLTRNVQTSERAVEVQRSIWSP